VSRSVLILWRLLGWGLLGGGLCIPPPLDQGGGASMVYQLLQRVDNERSFIRGGVGSDTDNLRILLVKGV